MRNQVGLLCFAASLMVLTTVSYGTAPEYNNGINPEYVLADVSKQQQLKQSDIIDHNSLEAKYALSSFSKTETANEVQQAYAVISPGSSVGQLSEQDNVSNISEEAAPESTDSDIAPEPGTMLLFGVGLAGFAVLGMRRKPQSIFPKK